MAVAERFTPGTAASVAAIRLPATLTMPTARAALAEVSARLAQAGPAAEVDASGLVDLDTAALAVLLDCSRQARARGQALAVTGAPPKLAQLATLYGVDGLLAV